MRGDDYLSSQPIARLLKRRNPEGQRATSTLPYSVLLRMGFTKPAGLPTAGALLPHLSTLTTCVAVSFSMALSLGSLPPDVIRHPALRSSDFPHALRPAIIFPARVLQYSMETGFFQEKDKIGVSVKFSSVIHLTVDNYYLRGFGLISISVSLWQVFPGGKKKLHKRLYALPGILAYSSSAPHSAYSWRFCALPAPRLCAWLYPSFCSSSH